MQQGSGNRPRMRTKWVTTLWLTVVLAAHGITASAADDWYIVEVIVFEHARGGGGGAGDRGSVSAASGANADFQVVGNEELQLSDVWQKLSDASQYRPVFHKGWLQPGVGKEDARSARIRSGGGVSGTIRMYRNRYLHIDADLLFGASSGRYRIKESRRMRSRELHYLDHPRFGMLIVITPS